MSVVTLTEVRLRVREAEFAFLYLDSVCFVDCFLLRRSSQSRIGAERTEEENKRS